MATWWKELTHWKRPWCWERVKAGEERDNWGWDGWMASLTWWTWVWAGSGIWWWTGKTGMLQSMVAKSQTWLSNWTELMVHFETLHHKFLYKMWCLGQISTIPQEYPIFPTSFTHKTMSPLLNCLCTFSKYKFSQPV